MFSCSKDLYDVWSMEKKSKWEGCREIIWTSGWYQVTSLFSCQTDWAFHSFSLESCSTETQHVVMTAGICTTVTYKPSTKSHQRCWVFPIPLNYMCHKESTWQQQIFDPTRSWVVIMQGLSDPNLEGSVRGSNLLPLSSSNHKWREKSKGVVFWGHLKWGLASSNSHRYQTNGCKCSSLSMTL